MVAFNQVLYECLLYILNFKATCMHSSNTFIGHYSHTTFYDMLSVSFVG